MIQNKKLNNQIEIPAIGFGVYKIPAHNTKDIVKCAIHEGYTHIDTASRYKNETETGQAIKESGSNRKNLFVTTKVWNDDLGFDSTLKAFDSSLERLGLEYIDLYLIHWPYNKKRIESWKALEEIYKSGKVRAIGVSNFTVRHITELLEHAEFTPSVNQIEFHPFLNQNKILDFCQKHNILVEAHSTLTSGNRLFDSTITTIAQKYKKSNAQVLLRWALQKGTVPLVKTTRKERLKENLSIFDFSLIKEDMDILDKLDQGLRFSDNPTTME